VGLGLVVQLAVVPHHNHWSEDKARRTLAMASPGLPVVGIDERTALIHDADGWRVAGAGSVAVHVDGEAADLSALP
jgi:cyanophycinase-like exopeptidase